MMEKDDAVDNRDDSTIALANYLESRHKDFTHRRAMQNISDFEERTSYFAYILGKRKRPKMFACSCKDPDTDVCHFLGYPQGCLLRSSLRQLI